MALVVGFPGLHKITKKSATEPWHMTFEAQNFLRKEDTNDYELLRLEDVAMCTAAVAHVELLISNLYFQANDRIHAFLLSINRSFLLSINRSTCFFSVVEVSACFWAVPGQSGEKLPIFTCP